MPWPTRVVLLAGVAGLVWQAFPEIPLGERTGSGCGAWTAAQEREYTVLALPYWAAVLAACVALTPPRAGRVRARAIVAGTSMVALVVWGVGSQFAGLGWLIVLWFAFLLVPTLVTIAVAAAAIVVAVWYAFDRRPPRSAPALLGAVSPALLMAVAATIAQTPAVPIC